MKLVTLDGEYYAKSTVGKGYEEEYFSVKAVYPFDISMGEDLAEREKRQRAFMFLFNFNVENLVKEELRASKELKSYGGSIRTCSITEVEDISTEELKKPKHKKLRDSISFKKNGKTKIIKPEELTYNDVMGLGSDQIVFALMASTNPLKEDPTQLISRHLHDFKKGTIEAKRKILCKYLNLKAEEAPIVNQELEVDESIFENENVKTETKTSNKATIEETDSLEAAAGVK